MRLHLRNARTYVRNIWLLFEQNWPFLAYLDLSHIGLHAGYMAYLVQGQWPQLAVLKLGSNDMTAASRLEQAQWPLLRHLDLGDCVRGVRYMVPSPASQTLLQKFGLQLDSLRIPCVVPTATEVILPVKNWPLHTFLTVAAKADPRILARLAEGCWPLKALHLAATWLNDLETAMSQLLLCRWNNMEQVTLSIRQSHLQENQAKLGYLLASCNWPLLWRLDLSSSFLTDTFIVPLVDGNWPCLQELDLGINQLEEAGVKLLVEGQWPVLRQLKLNDNTFTYDYPEASMRALSLLFWSKWPTVVLDMSLEFKSSIKSCSGCRRDMTNP